jgi:hypothetical protein
VFVCFDTEAEANQNSAQIAPLVQYYDTLLREGRLIPFVPQVLTSLAAGAAVWLVGKWLSKRISERPKRKMAENQTPSFT